MTKVNTRVGVIDCPNEEDIGPRTKYWAEAIFELIRIEELYMVIGAALEEAYMAGRISALQHFMNGLSKMEVVDVEATVVEAGVEEREGGGPEPEEPAPVDQADGSAEPGPAATELSGSVPEGALGN